MSTNVILERGQVGPTLRTTAQGRKLAVLGVVGNVFEQVRHRQSASPRQAVQASAKQRSVVGYDGPVLLLGKGKVAARG